jgi:hypothetical protein
VPRRDKLLPIEFKGGRSQSDNGVNSLIKAEQLGASASRHKVNHLWFELASSLVPIKIGEQFGMDLLRGIMC